MKRKITSKSEDGLTNKKICHGMTLEEITVLKQPLHINMLNFQVEELLKEATVDEKTNAILEQWINIFQVVLKGFPTSETFSLSNYDWMENENLVAPFAKKDLLIIEDGQFAFHAPEAVSFTGAIRSQTCVKHSFSADILLHLPKDLITKKDLQNGKWLVKRALYLTWLGKLLEDKSDLIGSVKWSQQFNSPLRPILQVTSANNTCAEWTFNLFPVPGNNAIQHVKVCPTRGNIEPKWFYGDGHKLEDKIVATPSYNWLCGIDIVRDAHFKYIKANLKGDFAKAVILLKIWLQQRTFNQGDGCINGHIITLYVLLLLEENVLTSQMTSYQIFRLTLVALARSNWTKDGAEFKLPGKRCVRKSHFHDAYDVVFLDPTGYFNLAGGIHANVYDELKSEAGNTVTMLDSSLPSRFDMSFIEKVEFSHKFDHILRLKLSNELASKIMKKSDNSSSSLVLLDTLNRPSKQVWKKIISLLTKGLEGRVSSVGIRRKQVNSWDYGQDCPLSSCNVVLGFILDSLNNDGLTKGPSGDEVKAVKEFRDFWGELSELRRFKDGSFLEVVKWGEASDPIHLKRQIPGTITRHLLKRHFALENKDVTYVDTSLEDFIKSPVIIGENKQGTGEELTTNVILAYDSFCRQLKQLSLPLGISSVHSASHILRHGSVFPPINAAVLPPSKYSLYEMMQIKPKNTDTIPPFREPIDVLICFEASGKWPDDLEAIQAVKIEFILKMFDELKKAGTSAYAFEKYLLVLWEGYLFKVAISYRKEIYLLKLVKSDDGKFTEEIDTEAALNLELATQILPKLTSSLQRLQFDNSIYSCAVRIALRWASAQLLLPHIPSLLIELFMAHIFMRTCALPSPQSSLSAFLRFLNFVATTDWQNTPIVINFDDQLSSDDEALITERFHTERDQFPPIFVCTSCELKDRRGRIENSDAAAVDLTSNMKFSSLWTKEAPVLPAIARLRLVAIAAGRHLSKNLFAPRDKLDSIFRPSFKPFYAKLCLTRSRVNRFSENIITENVNRVSPYQYIKSQRLPVIGFDTVTWLIKDLTDAFGKYCLFLYDQHGGVSIGVFFKPSAEEEFTNNQLKDLISVNGDDSIKIHSYADVMKRIKNIGKGIIKNIKINPVE